MKLGEGPPRKSRHGVMIAEPAVKPPRLVQEKIEAAVLSASPGRFKRLKFHHDEMAFVAGILNLMLRAHPSVHAQMIHPTHGQFDGTAAEAARSFVRSFAARHRIAGVQFDKAYYK